MLRTLRAAATGWVIKGLFIVLILSFAVWGIGDYFMGRSRVDSVAEVAGIELSEIEARRALRREVDLLRRMGSDDPLSSAELMRVAASRVIDGWITNTALDELSKSWGLRISQARVSDAIRESSTFLGLDGRFDRARFEVFLQQIRLSESGYVAEQAKSLRRDLLASSWQAAALMPESVVRRFYRHDREMRQAEVARIAAADMPEPDLPALHDMESYYKKNMHRFVMPERRDVSFLMLALEAVTQQVEAEITDDEIRLAYQDRLDEFRSPEKRHLYQIVFDDLLAAEQALRVARASGLEAVKDMESIDLGVITSQELPEILRKPVFAANKGEVLEPIKSDFGFHLIQVKDIVPAHVSSLEEVHDRLLADLTVDRSIEDLLSQVEKLDDILGGGATLEAAATKLGLRLRRILGLNQAGVSQSGQLPPDRFVFVERVFAAPEGEQSLLEKTGEGHYIVFRVDSVIEEAPRPFEDVDGDIRRILLNQKRVELAQRLAEDLINQIVDRPFSEVFSDYAPRKIGPLRRYESIEGVTSGFIERLFRARHKTSFIVIDNDGVDIGYLDSIESVETLGEDYDPYRKEYSSILTADIIEQIMRDIRKRFRARVHNNAAERLVTTP